MFSRYLGPTMIISMLLVQVFSLSPALDQKDSSVEGVLPLSLPFSSIDKELSDTISTTIIYKMDIEVGDNDNIIPIDGGITFGDQGEIVPVFNKDLNVQGHITEIDVRFLDLESLDVPVRPYMVSNILGTEHKPHPAWNGHLDHDAAPSWELQRMGYQDEDPVNILRIKPAGYHADGKYWYYRSCEIIIQYTPYSNGDEISSYEDGVSSKTLGGVKYLIITHQDMYESALKLARWKSQKGVFAEVVTTNEIKDMYATGDIQKKMRKYVSEMEEQNDLDYLLLLGDVDKVKTRNTKNEHPETAYGEGSTFATDGYFGCVDPGTTWNSDGDSWYAEGNELDDPTPDMAVGRISLNDPSEISSLFDDLIERERNYSWNQKSKDAVFIAGDPGSVPGYPPTTLDHFWDTYADDIFESRETLYYDGSGTKSFSSQSFIETVGNSYQFLCYFSHGTVFGFPGLFSSSQISSLSNNGPDGMMFTMACLTGQFDGTTDSFSEVITTTPDKGLVGYIGSSRLAVGSIDTTYSGDAPGLEEDYWRFVREAFNGNIPSTTGDIYRSAITNFVSSFYPFPTSYYGYTPFRTYLEYNLFGDPEAPVYLRSPEVLKLEYDISNDNKYLDAVVLNSSLDPVPNASVTIYREGEIGITMLTNETGQVNMTIPPSNGGVVNITAWKRGDIVANDTFSLPDLLAPQPMYLLDPDEPDGNNGIYLNRPGITLFADEVSTIEYTIDDVENIVSGISPVQVNGTEGIHDITFRATDLVGHVSEWITFNYTLDTMNPEIITTTDPHDPDGIDRWFNSPVDLTIGSNEGLIGSFYRYDGGVETKYSEPVRINEGIHSIQIRIMDLAGNINTTSIDLKVDSTSPYSTIDISHGPDGDNGIYVTRPSIALKAFDENGAHVQYKWGNQSNWTVYSSVIYPGVGDHNLSYRAVDSTGNHEDPPNNFHIHYDPDPPQIETVLSPPSPDGKNGFYITRPWIEIRDVSGIYDASTIISYAVVKKGDGFEWINDSIEYSEPFQIPEGEWIIYARAIDGASNSDYHMPLQIKVDTTAPSLSFKVTPDQPDGENNWYISRPILDLTDISNGSKAYFRMDVNAPWEETSGNLTLPQGDHTIYLKPVDTAGNNGTIQSFSYKCDISDPIAVLTSGSVTYFVNDVIDLDASSSYDDNGVVMYLFNDSYYQGDFLSNRSSHNITFPEAGNYTVKLSVFDQSGRFDISTWMNVTILDIPDPPENNSDDDDDDDNYIPYDPDPNNNWVDPVEENQRMWRAVIVIALITIIFILLVLVARRRKVQEVEWEDEDSWMEEDWVDVDPDDEPYEEDDVMIFE